MTLGELRGRATELFSSILVFCPNFPPAAHTTTAKKFEELEDVIRAVLERTRSQDGKHWLRVSQQEVQESRKFYEGGDRKKGRQKIQRAEEHFGNAFAKKEIAPRFIAGSSGPAQDVDAGFPT